jgi:hypothetical protein
MRSFVLQWIDSKLALINGKTFQREQSLVLSTKVKLSNLRNFQKKSKKN